MKKGPVVWPSSEQRTDAETSGRKEKRVINFKATRTASVTQPSTGDGVPTKQSVWRNHLPPYLDAIESVLKAETASLTSEKRLAEQRTTHSHA
jgi:hypothetical protein